MHCTPNVYNQRIMITALVEILEQGVEEITRVSLAMRQSTYITFGGRIRTEVFPIFM